MANKVVAHYLDGRVVKRHLFFVLPADARSSHVRVLVNRAAVKRMTQPPPPAA